MTPSATHLASRTFSLPDQQSFAAWSGDRNPMHLDAIAARRTQAGEPVVHGMHALLWALDADAAAASGDAPVPRYVDVRFKRFIPLDTPVELRGGPRRGGRRLEILGGGISLATIDCTTEDDAPLGSALPAAALEPVPGEPVELGFDDLAGRAGAFAVPDAGGARARFPAAAARYGPDALCGLAAASTLVGMLVPGLHSIFDGIDARLDGPASPGVRYAVTELDDRFRQVTLRVEGSSLAGTVRAFVRRPPVGADRAALADVAPGEFAGVRALVIGGSRGLGAATARALAAGGARVALSYARGEADARALAAELGERVSAARIDVTGDPAASIAALGETFDDLYYFATPHIFGALPKRFDDARFAAFCAFYVAGFARACEALHARNPALRAYYPSSVAADPAQRPRDMLEYAMAKTAGETLCDELPRALPGLRVDVERLPRTLTDQTATIVPVEAASAERLALAAVRRLRRPR